MGDEIDLGRRPFLLDVPAEETGDALACCPGAALEHDIDLSTQDLVNDLLDGWGPVLEVWEGYASDEEIRFGGSSGGAATAIALHCIESGNMDMAVHTGARADLPYLNTTVKSRTREELLAQTGSRYAPASPCDALKEVEEGTESCVFIGKPCDVAAVKKASSLRPHLNARIGCTIAFFCAGVPSTRGTLELMKKVGVEDPTTVQSVRYRGNGWPGMWTVTFKDGTQQSRELSYQESWGFLQRFRQWRCYICPDHSGEFADIAVGDPWYREIEPEEPGSSLIVVRSERGRKILKAAVEAGHITLLGEDSSLLPRSQPNLLMTRGGLWMRLKVLRFLGAAVPRYSGFPMARFWWSQLGLRAKVGSFTGTFKRVFRKNLRTRIRMHEWDPGKPRSSQNR
jgi:coenzyme F420 hydrogenase subunit beta